MIEAFTLLDLLQRVGDVTAHLTGLPIPGPVIGLALLIALLAVALIAAVLLVTGTPFETYLAGVRPLPHWPYRCDASGGRCDAPFCQRRQALLAGSLTGIVSALALAWMAGAPSAILASAAPKSVMAGIAMGIAEPLGGLAALTAVVLVATGVFVAVAAGPLFDAIGIRDVRARGCAAGRAAHGLGTARTFQVTGRWTPSPASRSGSTAC
ncbi:LrgB family protein [Phreatobacter sp.]|uniref:LrgB family protein n=1 Tax=Phreatobacter sp. TaxID=1966341 RepID=UPI0025F1D412|nr:LrgB family protein [Phreatobacter sp.]